jgi:uncharacterized membrane protein
MRPVHGWVSILSLLLAIYGLSYPVAVIGVAFNVHPPFSMAWAGSCMLFLQGVILALWIAGQYGWRRGLAATLWVAGLTFIVEYMGVQTGWPFGAYRYTGALFPTVLGTVPLAVMFAWLLVILAAYPAARILLYRLQMSALCTGWQHLDGKQCKVPFAQNLLLRARVLTALLAALLAVLLDLLIEPVAVHVEGYWIWQGDGLYYGIPASNFIAWFAVALILAMGIGMILPFHERLPAWAIFASPSLQQGQQVQQETTGEQAMHGYRVPLLMYVSSVGMFALADSTHGFFVSAALGALTLVGTLMVQTYRLSALRHLLSAYTSALSRLSGPVPLAHRQPPAGSNESS